MKTLNFIFSLLFFTMVTSIISAQPKVELSGKWLGTVVFNPNVELRLGLEVSENQTGEMHSLVHSLDQGAFDIPVEQTFRDDDSVAFEIPVLESFISGKFTDSMHLLVNFVTGKRKPIPVNFTRVAEFPVKKPRRPQEPHKPYPYTEETVSVENEHASGVTLAGTLTLPEGEGPFTAVILISGSGPNDRDATIFGHKVFLVLADYLTRSGIAVLRTDDRGSNKSTGDFNSADIGELASDVAALSRFLSNHPKINAHKIGVIGHSHGASVAPVATVIEPSISFAVLMAGSSACLADDMLEQTEIIYKQRGISELAIALNTKCLKAAFEIVKQDVGLEEAKQQFEEFIKSFEPELKDVDEKELRMLDLVPPLNTSLIKSFMTPAMKKDLFFQPDAFLEKMTCPTLILHGSKDVQVPVYHLYKTQQLIRSNGNIQVQGREFKGKNHLFQSCETCTVSEYKEIEETMSPDVLEYLANWINGLKIE